MVFFRCIPFVWMLHLVAAQDAFIENKFLAQRGLTMQPVQQNTTRLQDGKSGLAYQIVPDGHRRMCVDLRDESGDDGTGIQLWECNGHESQLWYFDEGSFQIAWAGNSNKCIDAGDQQDGSLLKLWECGKNDDGSNWENQNWGFDADYGTIYLINSVADASLCLGIHGDWLSSGNGVRVVNCGHSEGGNSKVSFFLQSGMSIRSVEQYQMCLDLPGGDTTNGNLLQMWLCNGLSTQYWVNDYDRFRFRLSTDFSKCLDAGGWVAGSRLMIWDCQDDNQNQDIVYDAEARRLYLAGSSLCLDFAAGEMVHSAAVQVWDCTDCWNQQFQAWGPASSQSELTFAFGSNDCPPKPSTTASTDVFPADHCQHDASTGQNQWPRFENQQELLNDGYWSKYFERVYGYVPDRGYPICTGAFQFLWLIAAQNAGVVDQPAHCDAAGTGGQKLPRGSYYVDMSIAESISVSSHIYNPSFSGAAVPTSTWAEVTHTVYSGDNGAVWFYMAVGSGVWYNVGNTITFGDHATAVKFMLGRGCNDNSDHSSIPATECELDFVELWAKGKDMGYNSIQFLHHNDCLCGPEGPSSFEGFNRACPTEIVDLNGCDTTDCEHDACIDGLKGGWEAKNDCACDSSFISELPAGNDPITAGYSNCGAF